MSRDSTHEYNKFEAMQDSHEEIEALIDAIKNENCQRNPKEAPKKKRTTDPLSKDLSYLLLDEHDQKSLGEVIKEERKIDSPGQFPVKENRQKKRQEIIKKKRKTQLSIKERRQEEQRTIFKKKRKIGPLEQSYIERRQQNEQPDIPVSGTARIDEEPGQAEHETNLLELPGSQLIPELQPAAANALVGQQVIQEFLLISTEIEQRPKMPWIKTFVILFGLRSLPEYKTNTAALTQNIEEHERREAEKVRQIITHSTLILFICWVVLGLIIFGISGTPWLLITSGVLPIRKIIRYYYTKQKNHVQKEEQAGSLWEKLRRRRITPSVN